MKNTIVNIVMGVVLGFGNFMVAWKLDPKMDMQIALYFGALIGNIHENKDLLK